MPLRKALPRICIALGFPEGESLLRHARAEADGGERFFEFRLDYLPRPEAGLGVIRDFLRHQPACSVMATCRRHQNGGRFNGSIEDQLRVLRGAIEAGAAAVDVEIESAESAQSAVAALRLDTMLIVSWHNYSGTPALEAVLRRMARVPADAYKLVTTAKKPSDAAKVLALAKSRTRVPLVLLAMGEMGFATRVLSPALGGVYTYASANAAEGTASGQICARHMRHLYRVDRLTKNTRVFGVVADPVKHSISPPVHNRAFQARRVDAVYLPFLVKPAQLKDLFVLANELPLSGFSVTIPHKQKIMRYLDSVDPLARRIGAVNTVWRKAGRWRGTNTDAEGVTAPLARRVNIANSRILIAGNGGAARGAAFALSAAGAKISITGRNLDRVRALAKACGGESLSREEAEAEKFDVVVHATPLGMHPHVQQCFFRERIPAGVVLEMVYNPGETELVKRAEAQGATAIRGIEMFLEQAVRQFEIWTGESAPRAAMQKAAVEALAEYL